MSLMRMALRDLLSNALKFSAERSTVTVRINDTEAFPPIFGRGCLRVEA